MIKGVMTSEFGTGHDDGLFGVIRTTASNPLA